MWTITRVQQIAFVNTDTGECGERRLNHSDGEAEKFYRKLKAEGCRLEVRFPRIWVPSPENRDLRQLLWHRHRLVQMRTRITNQLQAVAMNEGVRRKKALWSKSGRAQLESLSLAPWAARRRHDLLEFWLWFH